jgi:NADH-quinone oxidoreductase subunit A
MKHLSWIFLNYKFVFFLFILVFIISSLILFLSYRLILQNRDVEKVSPYECGFSPFDDARSKFDVRFYLVAILFIIFDLEVSFLFPWVLVFTDLGSFGFWSMFYFLVILTVGFVYEWSKGALEWE